jgi:hypothetical protein
MISRLTRIAPEPKDSACVIISPKLPRIIERKLAGISSYCSWSINEIALDISMSIGFISSRKKVSKLVIDFRLEIVSTSCKKSSLKKLIRFFIRSRVTPRDNGSNSRS